jgi:hypothetical protein
LPLLEAELNSTLPVVRANALLMIGHLKNAGFLPMALDTALDRSVTPGLRRAAFAAIALMGSDQAIPRLLAAYEGGDPQGDTCLDTAGALVTPTTMAEVLPALLQTDTILSAAIARMSDTASAEVLLAVLDYYLGHADASCNRRMTSYTGPVWKSIATYDGDEILTKVGRLLALWERCQLWDVDRDILSALLEGVHDPEKRGRIARTAAYAILIRPTGSWRRTRLRNWFWGSFQPLMWKSGKSCFLRWRPSLRNRKNTSVFGGAKSRSVTTRRRNGGKKEIGRY